MMINDIDKIKHLLLDYGFSDVKVISKKDFPNISHRLNLWLEAGYHGELNWLINNADKRSCASSIWSDVESAFVVCLNYAPDKDPRYDFDKIDTAYISVYARNNDYHDIMKKRLIEVAKKIETDIKCRIFVDTAPLAEKPLAQKAGLGWQGKHTNLVSREFGSWLFLGVLLTDLRVDKSDNIEVDHCGSCSKCLTACPTNAFVKPYVLDARRCISYLTIEYKGYIPDSLAEKFGNRIYGCDDCLAVCPWNKFAQEAYEIGFKSRAITDNPDYKDLLVLKELDFREKFSKSPIKRIGYIRFMRNILIASGNARRIDLIPYIKPYLNSDNLIIQKTASFALKRISL